MSQQLSTVAVGRAYELLVLAVLRRYSFQLYHSGRRGDGGADFVGHWTLTSSATRVDIVGQCKWRRASPLTPGEVREFESVVGRMGSQQTSTTHPSVAGLLASYSGFSRQAMQTGMNSKFPLILTQIVPLSPPDDIISCNNGVISCNNEVIPAIKEGDSKEGYISDFVLNHTAQSLWPDVKVSLKRGIEGRGVETEITLVEDTL